MRFGVVVSLLLHLIVLGAGYLVLPFLPKPTIIETPFIPVSVIDEAEIADEVSVPAAAPKPDPKPVETPPAPEPVETPAPKSPPPPNAAEPEPEPQPQPEPKKPEPAKAEPRKPAPKEPKQRPRPDELDLDALSAAINLEKQNEQGAAAPNESKTPREQIGAGLRLTATEEAKMQAAIRRCWNVSAIAGAPDAQRLVVVAEIRLNRDGTLAAPPRALNAAEINFSGNRFWKAAEREALSAIVQCQPYDFLSAERYETWREMELNFDAALAAGY